MLALITLHWFDLFVPVVLGLGMFLARHRPAAERIAGFVHWLLVFLLCSLLYRFPAIWLTDATHMAPDIAALIVYPVLAFVLYMMLRVARHRLVGKTARLEVFGTWEQRIAMLAGMLKAVVMLLMAMAWLNGRYVSETDVQEYQNFSRENFGGIEFPVLTTLQRDVLTDAYTGQLTRKYLTALLIKPVAPPPVDEKALAAQKSEKEKNAKPPKQQTNPSSADEIVDELDNGRGKKRTGAPEGDVKNVTSENKSGAPGQVLYHRLSLKGITGTGTKRLALINNKSLGQGESDMIKVEDRKVRVRCQEIRDSSVIIQVENERDLIELKLAEATNSLAAPKLK